MKFGNVLVLICVGLSICLFGIEAFSVVSNRWSIPAETLMSGAVFASLLATIRFLRRLWLDKSKMDLLYLVSYVIAPEELARLVTSVYFGALRKTATAKEDARISG